MWCKHTRQLIASACDEDLGGGGDITSLLLPDPRREVCARVVPRQVGVICGLAIGHAVCEAFSARLGQPIRLVEADHDERTWQDGDAVEEGTCVATLCGPQAAVLTCERTLLNFMGRQSGVATLTSAYVAAARLANPNVAVLDTRKTIPGWRELDKYAVRVGGGQNHRHGLYDAVLIKDNHIAGVPVNRLRTELESRLCRLPEMPAFVEVEIDTLDQFEALLPCDAVDILLLDNLSPDEMREAVRQRDAAGLRGKRALEASGGVTLETIGDIAATGVDRISVGAITHSASNFDIGLDL